MEDRIYQRPDRRLAMAEGPRVLSEIASLLSAAPFLFNSPRGDGHPVMVLPGFGAGDRSTRVIRGFLDSIGYVTHPWNLGRNLGPVMSDLPGKLSERLDEIFSDSSDEKVSLVGWSLGGVYARMLAHLYPDKVRQVITLGSPFAGSPRSTNAYPIFRLLNGVPLQQIPTNHLRLLASEPLSNTPSTAIFSKSDGIVPWQIASQEPSAIADNIEVFSSHLGLGFNASVLYALADRLANPVDNWRPFKRTGWKQFVYGAARLDSEEAGEVQSSQQER